jgi:hypothetical protein
MMNPQLPGLRRVRKPLALVFFLLLAPAALFAQNSAASSATSLTADQFAGTYKGNAKSPAGDISLTLEIKSEKGKVSGRLALPQSEQQITSSEIVGDKLTLKLGSGDSAATLTLQPRDDKLVGAWTMGGQVRAVELKKVPAATELSGADVLSGEWDGAADVQGEALPFTLNLKVEGEKVTGGSSSQLGSSTISSGSWKDGKLFFLLDSPNGQIAMMASLTDGKLIGDFDFSGVMQGKWVAVKRKP